MSARFSEMLVNRRRQMGMSVQQVANVIKIRPQILEYFENGDFQNMPPRGYAQGMISSYARYLGLNPRQVIDAYFDDLYEYERSISGSYTGNYLDAATGVTSRRGDATGYAPEPVNLTGSRYGRRLPQAGYVSDRNAAPVEETRRMARPAGMAGAPSGTGAPRGSRAPRNGVPRGASGGGRPPRNRRQPAPSRGSRGSGSGFLSDPRVLIGGAVALLVILILVVFLLVRSCSAKPEEQQTPDTVPVTAASSASPESPSTTSTDSPSTDDADKDADSDVPSEYKVTISVKDGESTWLEVKNGGKMVYAENVVGPEELNYTVTDSLEISVQNVDAVTVTKDGEKVDYDSKSGGLGKITITVPKPETDADGEDGENSGDSKDSKGSDSSDDASASE